MIRYKLRNVRTHRIKIGEGVFSLKEGWAGAGEGMAHRGFSPPPSPGIHWL